MIASRRHRCCLERQAAIPANGPLPHLIRFFPVGDPGRIDALLFCQPFLVTWHLETTNQRAHFLCLCLKMGSVCSKPFINMTGLEAVFANTNLAVRGLVQDVHPPGMSAANAARPMTMQAN